LADWLDAALADATSAGNPWRLDVSRCTSRLTFAFHLHYIQKSVAKRRELRRRTKSAVRFEALPYDYEEKRR
jgi:hypothetical protein